MSASCRLAVVFSTWLAWAGAAGAGGMPGPTYTPFSTPTRTSTFTVTATPTPTPTAALGCAWTTFRLGAEDDASWSRIDASGPTPAWPPNGEGVGPLDVTGDGEITVVVEGSSDTLANLSLPAEIPSGVAWSRVLERLTDGDWTILNLSFNNQSSLDLRDIRIPGAANYVIPWIESWPHSPCGDSGLASDMTACDPDVVVLVPESNDAMWPHRYPEQLFAEPHELVEALLRQCELVVADNPARTCLVPTVSKAPYVATWPATSAWIEQANALIRDTFPPTHVVDFSTATSDALDYFHPPWGYEGLVTHSSQRLHDRRAGRVLAALLGSTFTTASPVLHAEARLWNGVSGLSVFGLRWDTASLPDDAQVRAAVVEMRATYSGASGVPAAPRAVGLRWANSEAADGWQAGDWPASMVATAYSGAPALYAEAARGMGWSFALANPSTVSAIGYTAVYGFVTPSTLPPEDTYFNYDVATYDSAFGPPRVCVGGAASNTGTPCPAGDECTGGAFCLSGSACVGGPNHGAPCPRGDECPGSSVCVASDAAAKLHVYHCAAAATATSAIPSATATPPPPSATATTAGGACTGDCDASGVVTIDELVTGVNVALGVLPVATCPGFDRSGDGAVGIAELIAAVGDALHGCPRAPRRT